jgi:hypothetical protein
VHIIVIIILSTLLITDKQHKNQATCSNLFRPTPHRKSPLDFAQTNSLPKAKTTLSNKRHHLRVQCNTFKPPAHLVQAQSLSRDNSISPLSLPDSSCARIKILESVPANAAKGGAQNKNKKPAGETIYAIAGASLRRLTFVQSEHVNDARAGGGGRQWFCWESERGAGRIEPLVSREVLQADNNYSG